MDLSEYPKKLWEEAERRFGVISRLARQPACSKASAQAGAGELGLSLRQVYELIGRFRRHPATSSLVPSRSSGGKGKHRIKAEQDHLLEEVIREVYCKKQRPSVAATYRALLLRAKNQGLKPPSLSTLWRRVGSLEPSQLTKRGVSMEAMKPCKENSLAAPYPLAVVQMDHTPVDLILVDSTERKPIGRPYLTIAIGCLQSMRRRLLPKSRPAIRYIGGALHKQHRSE
jgi:putative transposase